VSELRVTTYEMPAARLGPENPLPPFQPPKAQSEGIQFSGTVPEEERKYIGYGFGLGCLPYLIQDDYDRVRRPRAFRVAVLENEILRATFLLELGGRLWSLFHKPSSRELLYTNPAFQAANLAVRNAWFSGGVEWNVSVPGHTPFTCSPLFAARASGDDGTPILRLYEWERIRGVPYQMDFYLPDGSPFLFARTRIFNPHYHDIPMYWWSNIAVAEQPDVRIVVPAETTYRFGYRGQMNYEPVPIVDGIDVTYATNMESAADFFYRIPEGHRPWIAALDKHGRGLIQASTARLRGRKLFVWGMGPGGRRWQEFLSVPGRPYLEIQAGLARTQAECLPMPNRVEWTWLEAYGLMQANPVVVHGTDWPAAYKAVEARLNAVLPQEWLESELKRGEAAAGHSPEEILHRGSGWGALERRRREHAGERPFCSEAIIFDDASLGPDQEPWLELLQSGALPKRSPADPPGACMVQPEWHQLLQQAVDRGRGDHWLSWLHLGIMHYYTEEYRAAKQAWEKSIALEPSAWAYRNLAVLAKHQQRPAEAAELWLKARDLAPSLLPLAIECCQELLDAGQAGQLIGLIGSLPPQVRANASIRVLEARAALDTDDLRRVEAILQSDLELTNLREGDVVLSDLWFAMHEKRIAAAERVPIDEALKQRVRRDFPPPAHIDFRMSTAPRKGKPPG
jgi:tetratricopeptide (TPR) repeat protein